jgi:bisphosphoglycerate-dependent phosphoglycerate mutase
MDLEKLTKTEVVALEIPTGVPIIYTYEQGRWQKST